jgi:ABC-type dipeptide/oligopeptide/nickel transport system permease subunit
MTATTDMTSATEIVGSGEDSRVASRSAFQLFWARLREDKVALFGGVVIVLLIFVALFGGPIAAKVTGHPNTAAYPNIMEDEFGIPLGPNSKFWFGADGAGRDLFVRTMYGARTSLLVGVVASGIAVLIGLVVGLLAGFFGGWSDTVLSRSGDVMLSLPQLLIAIGIVAACGTTKEGCRIGVGGVHFFSLLPGLPLVIAVIALFSWPYIARIVRGYALSLREREFVEASRSLGASNTRILFREVLPNLIGPLLVYTTLLIPQAILFEAGLSYLGLGVPPDTASWGGLLNQASTYYDVAWWLMLFPGLFLVMTTLAFNLLGDGLRDALDVRADR